MDTSGLADLKVDLVAREGGGGVVSYPGIDKSFINQSYISSY